MPAFREMAQEAGRDPKSLSLRLGGAPDDLDALKRFRDMGVDAVNVTLMSDKRDDILPILDRWARPHPATARLNRRSTREQGKC